MFRTLVSLGLLGVGGYAVYLAAKSTVAPAPAPGPVVPNPNVPILGPGPTTGPAPIQQSAF
jgi:hypothetical protein